MLKRWPAGFAALVVTLGTLGLVILDLIDSAFRRWWEERALTTDTVAGLLVLLVTVMIVDQVLSLRQRRDRSQATAAQAAIVFSQATRSANAVSSALDGSGNRDAASDEVRTYMTMLLIAAPVLIDSKVPRTFLERAQRLGGELARSLAAMAKAPDGVTTSSNRLDAAVDHLRDASTPLLKALNREQRSAASGDESH